MSRLAPRSLPLVAFLLLHFRCSIAVSPPVYSYLSPSKREPAAAVPITSASLRSLMVASGRKTKTKGPGSLLLSRNRGVHRKVDAPPPKTLSSKASRTVIRRHHTLQKRLAQALANNDTDAAALVQAEINANGGLSRYQQASIVGQSAQRGGDSSKILMEWLNEAMKDRSKNACQTSLRLLEVGCLSPDNAISKAPMFDVTHIDLNSQHPLIESQDFMERPLPKDDGDRFDMISLSLVLNYVPQPAGRGEMLRRTAEFLRRRTALDVHSRLAESFPSVFLVLPAPCVCNSRYLDEKTLESIMGSIGYTLVQRKLSSKLVYGLWKLSDCDARNRKTLFKKTEVNPGKMRNNFAIVVQ